MSRPPAARDDLIDSRASGLLDAYVALGRFSGVALLARGGQMAWARAAGVARYDRGVALTPATRFRFGSISKAFTAACVLELEAAGALTCDDVIARHLGELAPSWAGEITIRQLLTHSAGVPSLFKPHLGVELSDAEAARPATRADLVARFGRLPLRFAPGSRFEYSNSGYALLAVIVERVSRRPYAEYLHEQLLGPAGMSRTSTQPEPDDAVATIAGRRAPEVHPSWLLGAGDLIGPAGDLALWGHALAGHGGPSAATRERLLAAQITLPDGASYGNGFWLGQRAGRRVQGHDGALGGFVTSFLRWPDDDLTVVVLANQLPSWGHVPVVAGTVNRLVEQLGALALGDTPTQLPPSRVRLDDAALSRLAGSFTLPDGLQLELAPREGRLWAHTGGTRPWTLWGLEALADVDRGPRGQRCASFLRALADDRCADALAMFAPANARLISQGELGDIWAAIVQRAGREFRLVQLMADVATLRGRGLDLIIAFDDDDHIVGFHAVAEGSGAATARVELIPESDRVLRADGYAWAAPDVVLELSADGNQLSIGLPARFHATRTRTPPPTPPPPA